MIWFIVLAVLVVSLVTGWLIDRRRSASRDPNTAYRFDPSDVRGRVTTHDIMRDSYRSGMRKDPGSGKH